MRQYVKSHFKKVDTKYTHFLNANEYSNAVCFGSEF